MRIRRSAFLMPLFFLVLAGSSHLLIGQGAGNDTRLLLVDGTKTFASTMRVGALAGALKTIGLFDVCVRLVEVPSSHDDPLQAEQSDAEQTPFDVIVVLPRGLDDASTNQVWLVTAGLKSLTPTVLAGVNAASGIIDQIFQGSAEAIDVSEDLWPGLLATLYLREGWLR